MENEQEEKRCCSASPHDTKVMRAIRRWVNEHHPTDCDVDEAEQIIGLLERSENHVLRIAHWKLKVEELQQAAGITITLLEDKKLRALIENSERGMAYEDFLRIEADRLRPLLQETKYKKIVDNNIPAITHKDWPMGEKDHPCPSCGGTKEVCKMCGKNHFGEVYRHPYDLVPCKDCPLTCGSCGEPIKKTGQVPEYGEEVGKPGSRIPVGMNEFFECTNLNCPSVGKE